MNIKHFFWVILWGIVAKESYHNKAVDFSDLLKKIIPLKPDVVYIPGYGRDSGFLIKQAISLGMKTTFLGAEGWGEDVFTSLAEWL